MSLYDVIRIWAQIWKIYAQDPNCRGLGSAFQVEITNCDGVEVA